MKKTILPLLLFMLLIAPVYSEISDPQEMPKNETQSKIENALQKAKKANKLLIIIYRSEDFKTECGIMDKNVYKTKEGKKLLKSFSQLAIIAPKTGEMFQDKNNGKIIIDSSAHNDRIYNFPLAEIYAPDGTLLCKIEGILEFKAYKEKIEAVQKFYKEYKSIKFELSKKNPSSKTLNAALDIYLKLNNVKKVESIVSKINKSFPKLKDFDKTKLLFAKYLISLSNNGVDAESLQKALIKADTKKKYTTKAYQAAFNHYLKEFEANMISEENEKFELIVNLAIENGLKLLKQKDCKNKIRIYEQLTMLYEMIDDASGAMDLIDKAIKNTKDEQLREELKVLKKMMEEPMPEIDPNELPEPDIDNAPRELPQD